MDAKIETQKTKVDMGKFYKLAVEGRRASIENLKSCDLDYEMLDNGGISIDNANSMIENVIGKLALPLAIIPSLKINDK